MYSASSDGEHYSKCSVDALPIISDWKIWKAAVERNMRELAERVTELEDRNHFGITELEDRNHFGCQTKLTWDNGQSYATTDNDGFGGLCTCIRLVRSKKAALLQCIWLFIFIGSVFSRENQNLLREIFRRFSDFPPLNFISFCEKILKTARENINGVSENFFQITYVKIETSVREKYN